MVSIFTTHDELFDKQRVGFHFNISVTFIKRQI